MFGIGTTEFLVILLVAVLVLGPDHLPRIMRTFTKVMSDFRRISTDFQRTINLEAAQEERQRQQPPAPVKKKKKKKAPAPKTAEASVPSEAAAQGSAESPPAQDSSKAGSPAENAQAAATETEDTQAAATETDTGTVSLAKAPAPDAEENRTRAAAPGNNASTTDPEAKERAGATAGKLSDYDLPVQGGRA